MGVDVNLRTKACPTALVAAALGGHVSVVKELLDHGANPHDRSRDRTALSFTKKPDVAKLLLHAMFPTMAFKDEEVMEYKAQLVHKTMDEILEDKRQRAEQARVEALEKEQRKAAAIKAAAEKRAKEEEEKKVRALEEAKKPLISDRDAELAKAAREQEKAERLARHEAAKAAKAAGGKKRGRNA